METQTNATQVPPLRPKNWLVESILATIFCCLPFGIAGIVFASKVNGLYDAGNFAGALEASKSAGTWTKVAFFVGIAVAVIWTGLMFLGLGSAFMGGLHSAAGN